MNEEYGTVEALFTNEFSVVDTFDVCVKTLNPGSLPETTFIALNNYKIRGGLRLTKAGRERFSNIIYFRYELNLSTFTMLIDATPKKKLSSKELVKFNEANGDQLRRMFGCIFDDVDCPNFTKWFYRRKLQQDLR